MLGLGNTLAGGSPPPEFTPADLGSKLICWLPYNEGQTNLSGTDGNADNEIKWADASGNGRHATQRVTAEKPSFSSGHAVFADGAGSAAPDNFILQGGAIQFGRVGGSTSGDIVPFSITIAIFRDHDDDTQDLFLGGDDSTEFLGFTATTTNIKIRGKTLDNAVYASGTFPDQTILILTFEKAADGSFVIYKSGDALSVASGDPIDLSSSNDNDLSLALLGSYRDNNDNKNFGGRIYEFIVCDAVLSAGERANVASYLASKLGV